ncbi:hypothetical protein [Streptomyces sp. NBC_00525]|uniref:hypothetical protein n=1 Tax=Streptomyces sp. NBC_00525 TaxID=2903660 RepID=UPI002E7FCF9B|nr:hypothetical protein [Streptomyces sp. NBC_00525]WUC94363.1 hypothetical protein OG710_12515 [Streptomyces sp. NBC_00525]
MSGTGTGEEPGARAARVRALALLRIRGRATAAALLPAALAAVLFAAGARGFASGDGWDAARWAVAACALVVLLIAAAVAIAVARAKPAVSPTVPLSETAAPDLYRLVRELADRLDVPAPAAIALTPDCDSWLEDRARPAGGGSAGRAEAAPVLVIGSPFLWWMRVGELRAVLAPVVAGTSSSAHPDIAAARRFVRGLDGAVADAAAPGRGPVGRVLRLPRAFVGRIARMLLRSCRGHAAEMERGVAAAASTRAQAVDYGVRIVAQEQVGLAYAGWDRLLTRVALPAWRMGRWPSQLDAGVVCALTELSRRDRLAEGYASRLGERPACDLLEEPGAADEAVSLLAARLFHGGPAGVGADWAPVDWQQYPDEVVDRKWRSEAARLHRVLDALGDDGVPTLARVVDHLEAAESGGEALAAGITAALAREEAADRAGARGADGPGTPRPGAPAAAAPVQDAPVQSAPVQDAPVHGAPTGADAPAHAGAHSAEGAHGHAVHAGTDAHSAEAHSGASAPTPSVPTPSAPTPSAPTGSTAPAHHPAREDLLAPWGPDPLPLFPLQPPRTGIDLLVDHVAAMVCCAAVDTAGAAPGLDWLDGPALLVGGERGADLGSPVLSLIEDGDAGPLRSWLDAVGVRVDKPVRLV